MPDPTAPVFDDRARRAVKVAAFVTFAGPPIGAAAYLVIRQDRVMYDCKIIRRSGTELGVKFLATPKPITKTR